MFEFFDYITSVITTIYQAIENAIASVILFFEHIAAGVAFVNLTISALPPFCVGALGVIFGISVLTLFLGFFLDY